jgi:opacity protein-like surface antigen
MRKFLIGAASVAAIMVPAAQANAETDGYVDLALGQLDAGSSDLDTLSIGGAVATDLSQNWRVQFDVDTNRISDGGDSATGTNVAAHVYYEGDTWAVGGVLANEDFFFGSAWTLGLEGQTHLGALVLEGEVNFGTLEGFGGSEDVTGANVSATYYFTPNLSVAAGYDYFDIDAASDSLDTWSIDGEYKFDESQFSMFAGWAQTESGGEELDGWRIGGRYAFGDDTLQGRRSAGPRWLRGNGASFLPII